MKSDMSHAYEHGATDSFVMSSAAARLPEDELDYVVVFRTDLDDLLMCLKPGEERLLPQPREGYSPRWRNYLFDRLQRTQ